MQAEEGIVWPQTSAEGGKIAEFLLFFIGDEVTSSD